MQELLDKIGVNINVTFYLIFYSLIWVRILMMASIIPFLFGKPVPRYVTVAASMVFAVFIFSNIVPANPPELMDDKLSLVVLYIKEVFYGLTIGFAVSIVFHAFASVGQMIDNQRGMSIARILIPQLGQQGSITGLLLFQLGIVIYLSFGGHDLFLKSFFESFQILPVLEFPQTGPGMFALVDLFMKITGEVIFIAVQLATPVIIAIFLADLILGIANRVAPQINVWMLGFSVKGYIGIVLLFVSITMVAEQMKFYSIKANRHAQDTVKLLHGQVPEPMPGEEPLEEGLLKPIEGIPKVETK